MKFSLTSPEFNQSLQSSKSLFVGDLSFKYAYHSSPKLGMIVSRKYGNAVIRNLFKRHCRNIFRSEFVKARLNVAVIVRPNNTRIPFDNIHDSFCQFKRKLLAK